MTNGEVVQRIIYAFLGLLVWPAILYQVIAFYLGSEKAADKIQASKADIDQDSSTLLNAEAIISSIVALGLIYFGFVWVCLYVAIGTLVALAYEKAARSI